MLRCEERGWARRGQTVSNSGLTEGICNERVSVDNPQAPPEEWGKERVRGDDLLALLERKGEQWASDNNFLALGQGKANGDDPLALPKAVTASWHFQKRSY